eukprot:3470989-Rhodomonas_salina.5
MADVNTGDQSVTAEDDTQSQHLAAGRGVSHQQSIMPLASCKRQKCKKFGQGRTSRREYRNGYCDESGSRGQKSRKSAAHVGVARTRRTRTAYPASFRILQLRG